MTLKEYCEKFDVDYNKLITTLKEYMLEDSNVLRFKIDYLFEDIQYQTEGDITYEIYLNTANVQIKYHTISNSGELCDLTSTNEWDLDTKGELEEVFTEFYNNIESSWVDKAFAPYHGARNELLTWLKRLITICKGE